jgi:hypothetical protein
LLETVAPVESYSAAEVPEPALSYFPIEILNTAALPFAQFRAAPHFYATATIQQLFCVWRN